VKITRRGRVHFQAFLLSRTILRGRTGVRDVVASRRIALCPFHSRRQKMRIIEADLLVDGRIEAWQAACFVDIHFEL